MRGTGQKEQPPVTGWNSTNVPVRARFGNISAAPKPDLLENSVGVLARNTEIKHVSVGNSDRNTQYVPTGTR